MNNMLPMPDYYAFLGVPFTATQAEIKRAYRRLARKFHPDLNQQTQQAQDKRIKLLNEAYRVLSDPQKRALYGKQRQQARQRITQEVPPSPPSQQSPPKEVPPKPKMSWIEGAFGFVRELRRELREK
jgi:curved DNA-binding protein CbpA